MSIRVLGGLEVDLAGRAVDLGSPKVRVLLAVLLCRAGAVVPVTELVDAVWPLRPPQSAADNLRSYVHRLRRLLGAEAILHRGGGYGFMLDPLTVDARRFVDYLARADAARSGGDLVAARAGYRAGLGLWRGEPFAGLPREPIVVREAQWLDEQRLAAWERRADVELRLGGHVELVADLISLVAEQPYRERLRGQLMLALHRSGRAADALAAYRELRRILADELGVEPGRELADLHRDLLRDDGARDPAAAAPARAVVPAQLPPAPRRLTGRTADLRRFDELVERAGGSGPIVVVGPPGVGKTALVVHWARAAAVRFPDGLIFADLRGFRRDQPTPPIEAVTYLLASLGVPASGMPTGLVRAVALYRSLLASRRTLVVLDDARSADQVRPLLAGGDGALIVVTSRTWMPGLAAGHGAERFALDVLAPADAVTLLDRVAGGGRVAADPLAADLAEACGRLPLALCISAANLADRPDRDVAAHLAELLRDRLGALQLDGDAEFRLAATFDRSYEELEAADRRVFRLLGLVPGRDFTADVAATLCAEPAEATARRLDRLVRAHLVEPRADGRFGLHGLLAEYAARRVLETDDPGAARIRLYEHYLRRCDAATRALKPDLLRLPYPDDLARDEPAAIEDAVRWLDAEADNLVAVVRDAAANGPHPAAALLADLLRGYFWGRERSDGWQAAASTAVAAAGDERAEGMAELSLGDLYYRRKDYPRARASYRRARDLGRSSGWPHLTAAAESCLGMVCSDSGSLRPALEHFETGLEIRRQAGIRPTAATYNNVAGLLMSIGRLADTVQYCEAALARYAEDGVPSGMALVQGNLADVLRLLGDLDGARENATVALATGCRLDRLDVQATAHVALALINRDTGDLAAAAEHAGRILELGATLRDPGYTCLGHLARARVLLRGDAPTEAVTHFEAALRLARRLPNRYAEAEALIGLAEARLGPGTDGDRMLPAEAAVSAAESGEFEVLQAQALEVLAAACRAEGLQARAEQALGRLPELLRRTGYRPGARSPG